MITIGVRELRQNATKYLKAVAAGEVVQVTERGRPIAMLVPIPVEGPVARLENQGRLSRAEGDLLDLGPGPAPASGLVPPSQVLAEARQGER
ncbi:MAG: type II toxin-antitoxin system prevent-host-death family antitoxin [Armatimonadetes bacterium]|nr:type II toxin-antitoxin system prevent-host-death family antitoxin [Armatimonadota bacterium]